MNLSPQDCRNLLDALAEWNDTIGPKELSATDDGLDSSRYDDLHARLTEAGTDKKNMNKIVVLSDGETFTTNGKVVTVTDAQLEEILNGEKVRHIVDLTDPTIATDIGSE